MAKIKIREINQIIKNLTLDFPPSTPINPIIRKINKEEIVEMMIVGSAINLCASLSVKSAMLFIVSFIIFILDILS